MKISGHPILFATVDLISRKKERLARPQQKPGQLPIRRGNFSSRVDNHNDGRRLIKCNPRLAEDFRRNEFFVVWDNPAGVYNPKVVPPPFR
jgi:hypothetical protein